MAIHVALHHRTHYRYERPVAIGPQVIRLRPAPHTRARVLSYSLRVEPGGHFINWQQDPQSNYLARVVFPEPARELVVEVDLVTEMAVFNPFDFFLEPEAEHVPFRYAPELAHELAPFQVRLPETPRLATYLEGLRAWLLGAPVAGAEGGQAGTLTGTAHSEVGMDVHHGGGHLPVAGTAAARKDEDRRMRTIDFLVGLNQRLWKDIGYLIRLEPGVQTPETTLEKGTGSCRDSAWLLCQVLRHLGFAARFVSGYLIQLAPDVKSLDGPSGPEKDFTDLHAWCEVYLPGAGWIGLDPTSGLLTGEGHIPVAATPDPQSAAPVSGLVEACESTLEVTMRVSRIHESPRVTRPYTEEEWSEIERAGRWVDAVLARHDCRLTMGGEPTFVSIDDMDGEEWNLAALGPGKDRMADELLQRLQRRLIPGGFRHYGQGKWYPGEPLPRWAHVCYWREDGEPVWVRDELLADRRRDYGFTDRDSAVFIEALAERLGCGVTWIRPAYEDVWYHLWKERRLPANVDPFESNLRDEEERARLARLFEAGLDRVVGHVLPLRRDGRDGNGVWVSGPWTVRPERLYLIPGDSPMGLRLPLDSLPWVVEGEYPHVIERDPWEPRGPLPARQRWVSGATPPRRPMVRPMGAESGTRAGDPQGMAPLRRGESASWVVRSALCVEPRQGRLHVFLPPMETLEDYLEVLATVEETAGALDRPVVIEGYPPPRDPRLNTLKITPDPGVIEVNLHPARTWEELTRNTEVLYAEARETRLTAEKFMLDGRHSGTGGGNHLVIGGASPADSPLLRRPDLLRSLVAYWQNHPSLSFLFSGLFIGPTSQSPRVDEARNDSLRELEIAFRQVPGSGEVPPWLVDRLFRNLLVDGTGNTHRAEFCIDKLYAPEGPAGRLGLLEMRGFEMPPHARMSLAQQLLVRALVARFWKRPYEGGLVRWGTEIHDRWMLPHFIWRDLGEVIAELRDDGCPMREEWFAPHFEFRFPQIGDLEVRDIHLEVRQALEPWHVLGEEPAAGGTVRYVDSSLERVQVRVRGWIPERFVLAVGGVAVPLHPTGTRGERVAGVRYRAWQPASCLHPTIGVHAPLVFDVVDGWNGRSVGGCTYHVMHSGGRSYETLPVNAYEAESRRLSRFFRHGHTPGPMTPRKAEPHPDADLPFTLDLRRA